MKESDEVRGDDEALRTLAESIDALGQLQPIVVGPDGRVLAGRRRFAALRLLGKETALAVVAEGDELDAELIEIDENFARLELTPLERSKQMARRKHLYAERAARDGLADGGVRFVTETAEVLGVSRRSVEREVQIGEGVTAEVAALIAETPLARSRNKLLELARLEPAAQLARAREMLSSTAPRPTRPPGPRVVLVTGFWAVAEASDFTPYADRFADDAVLYVVCDGCYLGRALCAVEALGCTATEVVSLGVIGWTPWEEGRHAAGSGVVLVAERGDAPKPARRLPSPVVLEGEDYVAELERVLETAFDESVVQLLGLDDPVSAS